MATSTPVLGLLGAISLPLNAEWVVLVIAYRHLQMRHWNLAIEICGRRYPDVVVLHYQGLLLR